MIKSELPPFELSVYSSLRDGKTVIAQGTYPGVIWGKLAVFPFLVPFGTPVREAYDMAMAFAAPRGIEVVVKDRHGLFPPEARASEEDPWL
jgi:hypothetical protein